MFLPFLILLFAVTTQAQEDCKADVVVVMDASARITEADFDTIKAGLVDLVRNGDFGEADVNWAFIQFSNTGTVLRFLRNTSETPSQAVDHFYYIGAQSHPYKGLRLARKMFEVQGREGAHKILIYISDGHFHDRNKAVTEARRMMRTGGVTIESLGVGRKFSRAGLEAVTSLGYELDATNDYGRLSEGVLEDAFSLFGISVSLMCY